MAVEQGLSEAPCEECGEPATEFTRDAREVPPKTAREALHNWKEYEPVGPWHPRCPAHPRRAEVFRL
jgi:hypothetical protein